MQKIVDDYCDSIYECALKIFSFFKDTCLQISKDEKDRRFKLNSNKKKYILSESIVYSFMLHEIVTYKNIFSVRNEILDKLSGEKSIKLLRKNSGLLNNLFTNSIDLENFVWARYEEYSNIYINKNECNLLYMPIGFPEDMYNDGFICILLRFHGVIIETLEGNHRNIPGIEKGPLILRDLSFSRIYSIVFQAFFETVFNQLVQEIRQRFHS